MRKLHGLTCIGIAVVSALVVDLAFAQRPIGTAKARGDYSTSFWGNSAGRSLRHARDYSSGFRTYARRAPAIESRIAQHEAAGVAHNLNAAKTQYAEIRKTTTDAATLAALDAIEKQLAAAVKAHQEMDAMCKMEMVDGEGTMKCCQDIDAALEKALAEHEKLMKLLNADAP